MIEFPRLSVASAVALSAFVAAAAPAANTYYVAATGGSDAAAGTIGAPFATVAKAVSAAAAGDTILVRNGTYAMSSTLSIGSSKSGTSANPYTLAAYSGESVTFDFATQTGTDRGIQLNASYWTIRGITVANSKDNGINISGSNNLIDRVVLRNNGDSGLQLSGSSSLKPSNNLILNTDSYGNYDASARGENADGFAAKFRDLGAGNVFRGVRAWGNSDDGFDFWAAANGVTVENSWVFANGVDPANSSGFNGDGNGFKLGHDSGTHVIRNNLVFNNPNNGIDVNGNALDIEEPDLPVAHGVTILNNTVYKNGAKNFLFDEAYAHVLRNNVSVAGGSGDTINGASTTAGVNTHNTWLGGVYAANAADFLSVDASVVMGARQADGSLPILNFLRLAAGSNLIDVGTNVGTPFNGTAPDLGAFETAVPEPATLGLLGVGAVVGLRRRRA